MLDPFMGSGSTALAAIGEGRRYIGYEISAQYCQLAETRLSARLPERVRSQSGNAQAGLAAVSPGRSDADEHGGGE